MCILLLILYLVSDFLTELNFSVDIVDFLKMTRGFDKKKFEEK